MTVTALLALVFAFVLPASALAQSGNPASDPTASQYENPANTGGGETNDDDGQETVAFTPAGGGDDGGSATPTSTSSSLPFTGFDVGVLAIVALLLGAAGLALRRLSAVR